MSAAGEVAVSVGKLIAQGCRRSWGLPPFARVAQADDAVHVQTLDGAFYRISVEPADASIFPPQGVVT